MERDSVKKNNTNSGDKYCIQTFNAFEYNVYHRCLYIFLIKLRWPKNKNLYDMWHVKP